MAELGILAILLVVGLIFGSAREKQHYEDIKKREAKLLATIPTRTDCGPKISLGETFLVTGSVVVASDYFKNFVGSLKNFFGGRLASHESLLDRARREALLRMREKAKAQGAREIVDVHIETSFLDQLGVEVSAYGTAVR